jgi:hypothetical protein
MRAVIAGAVGGGGVVFVSEEVDVRLVGCGVRVKSTSSHQSSSVQF